MKFKDFPEYELTNKKVELSGCEYEGFFPKKHTNVKGVVLSSKNLNAGDPYANISRYNLEIYVLKKDSDKWEEVYSGLKSDYSGELDYEGIKPLLFSLEDESFKRDWHKKSRIKSLKQTIKDSEKELKKLQQQ